MAFSMMGSDARHNLWPRGNAGGTRRSRGGKSKRGRKMANVTLLSKLDAARREAKAHKDSLAALQAERMAQAAYLALPWYTRAWLQIRKRLGR